jgi:hypothetical protein
MMKVKLEMDIEAKISYEVLDAEGNIIEKMKEVEEDG